MVGSNTGGNPMVLFRRVLGDVLRAQRVERGMTLREVSAGARVSLGYISEIERGQKEASSELLSSLCTALDVSLSTVLREVSDAVAVEEAATMPTPITVSVRSTDVVASAA
jgi:transcriptional regulator with XRE-family HTH domain